MASTVYLFCALAIVAPFLALGQNPSNMNPTLQYTISNPAPGFEGKTYPFLGEYFEVETPLLQMQYSEVYWKTMDPVPLPSDIVKRFENSSIAITGFEVNVYRHNKATGKEDPVPAYQSYNHHYSPNIVSSALYLKLDAHGNPTGHDNGHRKVLEFEVRDNVADPPADVQLNQAFVHGNGQEHRQIYHGNPSGYVQTIYAPGYFVLSPMQIDTNDGTGRVGAGGPLPKFSRDYAPADATYSPLLECPCTTRITKAFGHVMSVVEGQCSQPFTQSEDCFVAATKLLGSSSIKANATANTGSLAPGCLVARVATGLDKFSVVYNTYSQSTTSCQGPGSPDPSKNHLLGSKTSLVTVSLEIDGMTDMATISLTGPAQYWFGIGFNATAMQDQPYAIIVDGTGVVQERKLANHDPGIALDPSVKIVSSSVKNGMRTVVLQRLLEGITPNHYTFSPSAGTINFINALGDTVKLSQHKQRAASTLVMFHEDNTPSCLCTDRTGSINGIPFNGDCRPEPISDLLEEDNPTCQTSSYVGGLACCIHKAYLLDADQNPPPFVDEVYFKFRFYFQEYNPNAHQLIHHVEWSLNGCDSGTDGPNPNSCRHIEFDIVKGTGSPEGDDVQVLQSTFTAAWMFESSCDPKYGQCMDGSKVGPEGFKLMMAAAHCHAPNCLRQELINLDTGEVICNGIPVHGRTERVFDESGYLYIPPCTWGTAAEGFRSPPIIYMNSTLQMLSYYNSTYYHPGQMGIWQMKAAYNV